MFMNVAKLVAQNCTIMATIKWVTIIIEIIFHIFLHVILKCPKSEKKKKNLTMTT